MRELLIIPALAIALQQLGTWHEARGTWREARGTHPAPGTGHAALISFHHLHLNDSRPPFLIDFYERLFDPSISVRTATDRLDSLRAGSMLMVINRAPAVRELATAIWHFGWGRVSLGETYLAHARHEVSWEPPLPADLLHMHLRSVTPSAAAAWYREVLGVRVELAPTPRAAESLPRPEHRMPEALVWLGETALLIYRTEPPLFSTRGQRADHLAIACADLNAALSDLRRRGVHVLIEPGGADGSRTAMIEGPDHIAIELVETQ